MTDKKNFDKETFLLTGVPHTYIKEIKLSKYKLNSTRKYINLLDNKVNNESDVLNEKSTKDKDEKPITHLLIRLNVFTLERSIHLLRNHVPEEIARDL
jgi:hypothetical protein